MGCGRFNNPYGKTVEHQADITRYVLGGEAPQGDVEADDVLEPVVEMPLILGSATARDGGVLGQKSAHPGASHSAFDRCQPS